MGRVGGAAASRGPMLYAMPVSAVRSAPASAICTSASTRAQPRIISSVVIVILVVMSGESSGGPAQHSKLVTMPVQFRL